MKFLDKLLIVLLSLLVTCVSLFLIVISARVVSQQYLSICLSMVYGKWETGALGIVLLIFSLFVLVYVLKPRKLPEAVVSDSELGKVCITLGAVESLVQKVIRDIQDVTESRIYIKRQEDGVSITLKITVNYDVIIPELASEMQGTIRDYVESTAGIKVNNVLIRVSNVSNQKAKAGK